MRNILLAVQSEVNPQASNMFKRTLLLLGVFSLVCVNAQFNIWCDPDQNEVYLEDGDPDCPFCGADNCGVDPVKLGCTRSCPVPGCYCAPGYKRNDDLVCVPERSCPGSCDNPCGQNEVLYNSTNCDQRPNCELDDCSFRNYYEYECFRDCTQLPPRCMCAPGFRRDCKGKCIPEVDCDCSNKYCQPDPIECGLNQVWNACANRIRENCPGGARPIYDTPPGPCEARCVCRPGYFKLGICIISRNCPLFP